MGLSSPVSLLIALVSTCALSAALEASASIPSVSSQPAVQDTSSTLLVPDFDEPVDIGQEWRFHAGDLDPAPAPDLATDGWPLVALAIPAPHSAEGGVSWLRKRIRLSPSAVGTAPVGVAIAGIGGGSYELYVDGELIGRHGRLPPDPAEAVDEARSYVVPASSLSDGELVFDLRIWQSPGLARLGHQLFGDGPFLIGRLASVEREVLLTETHTRLDRITNLAFAALFLLLALYHLVIWRRRTELIGYLWYGLMALVGVSFSYINASIGHVFSPGISYSLAHRIAPIHASLFAIFFIEFTFGFVLARKMGRYWRTLEVLAALSVGAALIASLPEPFAFSFTFLGPPRAILVALSVLSIVAIVVVEAVRGSINARIFSIGVALFALSIVIQFAAESGFLPRFRYNLPSIGFASMVVVMGLALSQHLTRTLNALDAANQDLLSTNVSIQRFVPFDFLRLLGRSSVTDIVRGDHVEMTMTVMFSDIRGFTSMSERRSPGENFDFINTYLSYMEPCVNEHGGFVNQYYGDGIMALFPTSADDAVAAGIETHRALAELNRHLASRGVEPVQIGVGLNTGPLMLGTIGGRERLDTGVIGDAVNLAARVEGMREYGARLLLSEHTKRGLREPSTFALRRLDTVVAKGKTESFDIYEVLDADPPDLKAKKLETRNAFEEALASLQRGQLAAARDGFLVCTTAAPDDRAAGSLLARTQRFLSEGLPEGWNGVNVLTASDLPNS